MFAKIVRARAGGLLLVALQVLLGGCAKPTVVGKWTGTVDLFGQKMPAVMEFKKDGTLTQNLKSSIGEAAASGTYTVDGKHLAMYLQKVSALGKTINLPENSKSTAAY